MEPDGCTVCAAALHDCPFGLDVGFSEPVDAEGCVVVELEDPVVEIDFGDGGASGALGWVGALEVGDAEAVPALEVPVVLRCGGSELRDVVLI